MKTQKIAVLCLPGIGDGLMATPLVQAISSFFPGSSIDILCMFSGVRYVYQRNPHVTHIHQISLYRQNLLKGFSQILSLRGSYSLSFLAFPTYRREYHLVHFLLGAKRRISHRFQRGFFLEGHFLNTDLVDVDETQHNVINNLNLLNAFGFDWQDCFSKDGPSYEFSPDPNDISFGKTYIERLGWQNELILGIHPGSTTSPAALLRRWSIERYAKVAKHLIKKKGAKILIFAGPEERQDGKKLAAGIDTPSSCHLIEGTSFQQDVGILSQVRLLLCNDNGFGHLAVALGKPIVTLWASTNDRWSLPYNKDLVTLVRPPKFTPWYRYDLKRSIPEGMTGGMERIPVSQVIEAVEKTLS